jgi:hypothetical protein
MISDRLVPDRCGFCGESIDPEECSFFEWQLCRINLCDDCAEHQTENGFSDGVIRMDVDADYFEANREKIEAWRERCAEIIEKEEAELV